MTTGLLRGAPPSLVSDLAVLAQLPERARAALWGVLGPTLREDVPAETGPRLAAYAREHGEAEETLARTIKAWRFVLRFAHEHELDRGALCAEVGALLASAEWLDGFLAIGFGAAMEQLDGEAGHLALLEHGRLLLGADFRIDAIESSQRGRARAKIALLTLKTREGARDERVTVGASKEALLRLRETIDRALSRLGS